MSVLGDIRAGVKAALASLSVNGDGYLMSPVVPPCFELDFPEDAYVYDVTYGKQTNEMTFVVRGIVQIGDTTEAQRTMDDWIDPGASGVKELLQADTTLGGKVDDLFVERVSGPRRIVTPDKPNATLLAAEWTVRVVITIT